MWANCNLKREKKKRECVYTYLFLSLFLEHSFSSRHCFHPWEQQFLSSTIPPHNTRARPRGREPVGDHTPGVSSSDSGRRDLYRGKWVWVATMILAIFWWSLVNFQPTPPVLNSAFQYQSIHTHRSRWITTFLARFYSKTVAFRPFLAKKRRFSR